MYLVLGGVSLSPGASSHALSHAPDLILPFAEGAPWK